VPCASAGSKEKVRMAALTAANRAARLIEMLLHRI
jgi:hypothetical protein